VRNTSRRRVEDLQKIVSHGRYDRAVAILGGLDPAVAADAFASLLFEEQRALFVRLPIDLAAKLIPAFPYYDSFVLLHALSAEQRGCPDFR